MRERHGHQASNPKNKEAKKLDLFERNLYSSRGLRLHITNQQALLGQYDFTLRDRVSVFKDKLTDDVKQAFRSLSEEGELVAGLEAEDFEARSMASAITMRCSLWL